MFGFHRRCRDLETTLRVQIDDLTIQLGRLQDRYEDHLQQAGKTTMELLDRVLALTNPAAVRVLTPTQPMPTLSREDKRAALGRMEKIAAENAGSRALTTPAASGFRPAELEQSRANPAPHAVPSTATINPLSSVPHSPHS